MNIINDNCEIIKKEMTHSGIHPTTNLNDIDFNVTIISMDTINNNPTYIRFYMSLYAGIPDLTGICHNYHRFLTVAKLPPKFLERLQ